jgi:hypothetical protein
MARSPAKSRSASSSPGKEKSPPKAKAKVQTRKYVILTNELIKKLWETLDSDWDKMKAALVPHPKTKLVVFVELVGCINEFLAREIPDGQIPPQIVPKTSRSKS